jgi:excinuclease ABC subunit C
LDARINYYENTLNNINRVLEHSNILSLMDKYASDVAELAKLLGLPRIPARIEGYDISNIFGSQAVGSMVVFTQGEADKDQYRKFKIRTEGEKGDTQMLAEVLERRLKKVNDRNTDSKWPDPDLLIIDGGKQQLNTALRVLKKMSLDIPVISISKGEALRSARAKDKIFFPGQKEPLQLPLNSPALHIIKRVRDEAHRFAIEYHRKLRGKKYKFKE